MREYIDKYRFTTSMSGIDKHEAEKVGEPIYHEDTLAGYFISDGFNHVGVTFPKIKFKGGVPKQMLWRVGFTITYLNEDRSIEDLSQFIRVYYRSFSENSSISVKESKDLIDYCIDKLDQTSISITKKYFWVMPLSIGEKQSIVMSNMRERKSTNTMKLISNAIDAICEEGLKFVTSKQVKKIIEKESGNDISLRTINRYTPDLRIDIDDYNNIVFGTCNYQTYRKTLSIHRIIAAIKVLDKEGDRLSRRVVAKEAELHFNTVQTLWMENEIQDELNNFNEIYNDN